MRSTTCFRHLASFLLLSSLLPFLLSAGYTDAYGVAESDHKRFEYKYSFKGPYLAQKDGSVPFWEYGGATIASEEMVRITPSLRSKKGHIWSRYQTNFDWWEVEMIFRVNGKGRIGADGLAFWYVDQKLPEGPVFGSADQWRGLALFFDSFDNDNKGNNPYVMAMVNDGTKSYDHNTDGINQQLNGCLRDFRNKPFPSRAKIQYVRNTLTVLFHSGNTNNEQDYELCMMAENVFLPQYGHFGISAATGGLADDHDVLKLMTYSVSTQSQQAAGGISDQDKDKYLHEYEMYKKKLEEQREDFLKQHPDEAKRQAMQSEKANDAEFDYSVRELRQIYQGQSEVFDSVKAMNRKLDEVIGRQERALSLISALQMAGGGAPQGHIAGGAPISRQEVESILNVQREVLQSSRDVKMLVQHQQPAQVAPAAVGSQDSVNQQMSVLQQILAEIRENMNVVRREFGGITTKLGTMSQGTPHAGSYGTGVLGGQCASCVSTTAVVVLLGLHLLILISYLVYQSNKAEKQKKFY